MTENGEDDRYRLHEPVGRGGMATVWRARDTTAEMDVALKVLHPHLVDDDGIVEAFEREAALMRELDVPGVARIFDTLTVEGRPAMAMALLPGGDLTERIGPDHPLGEEQAVEIMLSVLDALDAIHDRDVIHRDVKPHNIAFDADGEPKLIDFGIGQAEELLASDESGQLGTVEYMAPERLDGFAVDARSDLYSAGVVLFEMLCGHPPYRADNASAIMRMHREADVADPRAFSDGVSDHVAEVTMRAMAKHPEDRFDRAEQMAGALRGDASDSVELEDHPRWEDLRESHRVRQQMAAPVETDGVEWVIYVPSVAKQMVSGSSGDEHFNEPEILYRLADEYGDFAANRGRCRGALDNLEEDDDPMVLLGKYGLARGLSREGVDELTDRLEEAGLPARYGRRPRSRREESGWKRLLRDHRFWYGISAVLGAALFFSVAPVLEPETSFAARSAVFFSLCIAFGLLIGRITLPTAYSEWWRVRISGDFLFDFAAAPPDEDDAFIGRPHYELVDDIQSPRIAASYERVSNALLHLRDTVDDDTLSRSAAAIRQLVEQTIDVESDVAAVRPGRLASRIHQLDRRIADEEQIEKVDEMMEEKAELKARLTERDEAQRQLQSLAQHIHDVAGRVEALACGAPNTRLDEIDELIGAR